MPELSIIIVSYNTKDLLQDCLKSIYKAVQPKGGLETIVVDNNSSDDSVQMVKKEFPKTILVGNEQNLGFSAANNIGVKKAKGKYLLFLNSDTKVKSESLVKPLKYLKNHQDVGAITVKLILGNGQIDPDNHRGLPTPWTALTHFSKLNRLFPKSPLFNNYFQSYKNFNGIHRIDVTAGSYIMLSKKLFERIGGWDEAFFFYGEDIDLSYRITKLGKKIIYYPKVEVIHYKGASSGIRKESKKLSTSTKATRIRTARASTQAMKLFYKKHFTHKYPVFITTPVLLGITLLGQLRVLKYKISS